MNKFNQILTRALTADIDRLLECLGNRWIQLNYEILLESELVIAFLDLAGHPPPERIAQQRVNHVDNELTRQLVPIALIWQVQANIFALQAFLENGIDCEALIAGNVQVFGVLGFDD